MTYTPRRHISQFDGPGDEPSPFSYGAGEPPAGWTPFAADSVFNTPIPGDATATADSAAVVAWMNGLDGAGSGPTDRYIGVGGDATNDFDPPIYFAQPGDPLLRAKIFAGARDPSTIGRKRLTDIHDRLIPMPSVSTQAAGSDGHLVIHTATRAYEFWQGKNWTPGEGRFGAQWGHTLDLSGDGESQPFGASASGIPISAGNVRIVDIEAGHIPHAIAMTTKYVRRNVFTGPATGTATPDPGVTAGDANDLQRPVTGSRLQLNMSGAAIDALSVPAWKKVVLKAMAEYGLFIMDTGGNAWTIKLESSTPDVAHGQTDRWRTWSAAQGLSHVGGGSTPYILPLKAGVDWSNLRVLA